MIAIWSLFVPLHVSFAFAFRLHLCPVPPNRAPAVSLAVPSWLHLYPSHWHPLPLLVSQGLIRPYWYPWHAQSDPVCILLTGTPPPVGIPRPNPTLLVSLACPIRPCLYPSHWHPLPLLVSQGLIRPYWYPWHAQSDPVCILLTGTPPPVGIPRPNPTLLVSLACPIRPCLYPSHWHPSPCWYPKA